MRRCSAVDVSMTASEVELPRGGCGFGDGSDLRVGVLLDHIGVEDCVEGIVDGGGAPSNGGGPLKHVEGGVAR